MQVIVFGSACCKHSTVCSRFASDRCTNTTLFSDMFPNLANIMQFADVSFALLQNIFARAKFRAMNWCCIKTCSAPVLAAKGYKYRAILRIYCDLRTGAIKLYTGMLLHRETFTQRRAGTSTRRCLYTAMLWHRDAFTRMRFYTRILLTQSILYTQKISHTQYSYAEVFAQQHIYTEAFLNTGSPQILLQRGAFAWVLLHTGAFRLGRF